MARIKAGRSLAGRRSQVNGEAFENLFRSALLWRGVQVIRFPSGAKWTRGKLLPVPTPFDWILVDSYGSVALIDTKTTAGDRFGFAQVVPHQLRDLFEAHTRGAIAGYVIWFRESDRVAFFDAGQLHALKPRQSLGPDDAMAGRVVPRAHLSPEIVFPPFIPAVGPSPIASD